MDLNVGFDVTILNAGLLKDGVVYVGDYRIEYENPTPSTIIPTYTVYKSSKKMNRYTWSELRYWLYGIGLMK